MTPTEATRAFYDLFIAGKIEEALERFVDPEAVLENPLPEVIPFGGVFEGRQGFAAYLEAILRGISIERFEVDEIFADGERVTVLGRETSLKRRIVRIESGVVGEFCRYRRTSFMLRDAFENLSNSMPSCCISVT